MFFCEGRGGERETDRDRHVEGQRNRERERGRVRKRGLTNEFYFINKKIIADENMLGADKQYNRRHLPLQQYCCILEARVLVSTYL